MSKQNFVRPHTMLRIELQVITRPKMAALFLPVEIKKSGREEVGRPNITAKEYAEREKYNCPLLYLPAL
jgi:hypothetical protein